MSKHLYVHIPFCAHICEFCDFFRVPYQKGLVNSYLKELEKELRHYELIGELSNLETIYIGGGTPSVLEGEELEILLKMLSSYCKETTEFTLEANPENLDKERISLLCKYGINRVSLGIQCLDDEILNLLNRKHTASQALEVIDNLYDAGIKNISADVIYGLPKQTTERFVSDLERLGNTKLSHISMYSLTIEEHSSFGRKHQELIDNELEGEMYERGRDTLEALGFHQYEVANYARGENYHSKHNKGYWLFHDYVGVGMGAVGYLHGNRYENTKNFQTYLNGKYVENSEFEDKEEQMFLMLMMGLRLIQGMSLADFEERFGISFKDKFNEPLQKHLNNGYLEINDTHVWATPKGMELLHDVLVDFMD